MTGARSLSNSDNGGANFYANLALRASTQIRVLKLDSGNLEDPIESQLAVADVASAEYEALSYTWGGYVSNHTITLNSQPGFNVTDNLFAALRHFRSEDVSRILWVDAICINQNDLDERGQQVQLMGEVYRNAKSVLIWLGDANEPPRVKQSPFQPSEDVIARAQVGITRPSDEEDFRMRMLDAALCGANPQWWTRTWIIQEAVLAKRPVFCFGHFEIDWHELGVMRETMSVMIGATLSTICTDDIRSMTSNHQQERSLGHYVKNYRAAEDFDNGFQALETLRLHSKTWSGLGEIASVTAQSQATNPRDRVYGYYGLWSGQQSGLLEVDYRRTVAEVFASATFADMQTEGNLRTLNMVNVTSMRIDRLPTWALDFSFSTLDDHLPFFPQVVISEPSTWRTRAEIAVSKDHRRLTVRAIIFDRVKEIHPLPRSLVYPSADEEDLLQSAMSSIPLDHTYLNVQNGLTANSTIVNKSDQPNFQTSLQPPAHIEELAFRLGVQTDPISNVFLWWLSEILKNVPDKKDFSELYEWWKRYAIYQSNAEQRKSKSKEVFFITECGFIGRGLSTMKESDTLAFLEGLELPVVLSRTGNEFVFKGLAWINGAMMGELDESFIELLRQGVHLQHDILLI